MRKSWAKIIPEYVTGETIPPPSLKSRLKLGHRVVGIWSILPAPGLVEIAAGSGLDFVLLDGEHGGWQMQGDTLENAIRACEVPRAGRRCEPIVRVPGMNPFSVQSALDAGAVGVIVPQIANYEAACAAVEMIRYAPRGVRGFNPFTRAARYGRGGGGTDDESVLAGLIIENKTAFDDLERIVSIPELDIVYLGVYDMSVALGCAGDVHHPEVIAFVEAAIPVILEGGKTVGLMIHDTNAILYYAALGVRFFVYSVDTIVIGRSFERLAVGFRSATTSVADGEGSGGST